MASEETLARWLDLLIHHTELGNVQWQQIGERDTFVHSGSNALVYLESRDNDGLSPYVLTVTKPDGEITDTWTVWAPEVPTSDPGPEFMRGRVTDLWNAIQRQHGDDLVLGMLKELEDLPPF